MVRARELGIATGAGDPGRWNAITDVPGVRVGHTTLIEGEGPLVVGRGPIRTGVTVILPHEGDAWSETVFAAGSRLNGNGEVTGLEFVRECDWSPEIDPRPAIEALGIKPGKVMHVLYTAIEGRSQGLPLFDSISLLGRASALERLRAARARL